MTSFVLALVLATAAAAAPERWEIDSSHASVGFSIKHMMVSNVLGSFQKVSGTVDVDEADPTTAVINAEIETASINTGNAGRDDHLRNPDFFDAPQFPKITFVSKKVEKSGDKFKMTGDLTMHGVTKEITLDVEPPTDAIKDPKGNLRRGISATGKLNRKDWGLTWSKTMDGGGLMLGDEVKLTFELELVKKAPGAASPAPSPSPAKYPYLALVGPPRHRGARSLVFSG